MRLPAVGRQPGGLRCCFDVEQKNGDLRRHSEGLLLRPRPRGLLDVLSRRSVRSGQRGVWHRRMAGRRRKGTRASILLGSAGASAAETTGGWARII